MALQGASSMKPKHFLGKSKSASQKNLLMNKKTSTRYRALIFAMVMSCSTSIIVSAMIIGLHTQNYEKFITIWPTSFFISWPIVFLAILIIAPIVNKLLDRLIES